MRNLWQCGNTQQPQQYMPMRLNKREEQDRFSPVLKNRTSRISQERFGTNKFCGRTCYDVDTNQWYSCCSRSEDHVVQITFRETAEQRSVLLTDGCRNSRFFVVYE
ncbi:hypothetical protein WA026_012180 [Henosepilachna vigintioctopunctata]|uniref:Uncharacterized protein n=1 Tax=Henosepilachna vigintioctopunctata TaxID=420089 RepID=A0AAW1VFD1_9CUCU